MADTIKTNLGPVTAYADAKAHGYTGTREEFGVLLANAGLNLKAAETAKEGAEAAKQGAEAAKQAAETAQQAAASSASSASTSASTATTQAAAAKSSADAAASSATAAKASEAAAEKSAQGAAASESAAKAAQTAAETAKANADTAASNAAANATAAANSAADAKNTLESIPDDYSILSGKVDKNTSGISELKEDIARQNILIGSETGNPVSVSDAFSAPLCGLTVYGKSTQDGTPSPDNPAPIVSAGDGGTITVTIGDGADERQTITLQTPNGLPGIPVTSGGNYTDPTGRQWVCDEVDFERGILIRRINSKIYTGTEIWQKNNSGIFLNLSEAARSTLKGMAISNIAVPCGSHSELSDSKPVGLRPTASGQSIGFFFVNNAQPTLDDWKTALSKTNAHVQYVLNKPIESKLTDAELAAYKALTTYAPNTVAEAADVAELKLDYQRDVNIVIKNLEDAIASMTTT